MVGLDKKISSEPPKPSVKKIAFLESDEEEIAEHVDLAANVGVESYNLPTQLIQKCVKGLCQSET